MARSEILSAATTNTRKRQRNNVLIPQKHTTTTIRNEDDNDDIYQDSLINEMLEKQSEYLNNNLTFNNTNTNNTNNTKNGDDDDDDVVFIKEQPVQQPRYATTSNYNYNGINSNTNIIIPNGSITTKKKQRTISLPQLPLSKLDLLSLSNTTNLTNSNNNSAIDIIPRTQNDNELLNLTGSSTKTLASNKTVPLRVLQQPQINNNIHDINEQHSSIFTRKIKNYHNQFKTDKDGHYIYHDNDTFGENNKFVAHGLLGQGTFGKVLKCYDQQDQKFVAVKIIRAIDRYREAAKTELRVLNTIAQQDITGSFQCLLLLDYFDYKNHICLITNLHGKSIYDFMCANGIGRFPGSHIQAIARQLIRSICFLHELNIIHTDIKPENILLCDDQNYAQYQLPDKILSGLSKRRKTASNNGLRKILQTPEIKIIDFGSAVFFDEYHPPIISTRHYRAPEIVLGLSWSYPCDIWSIACVLVELATGESLYPIHNNFEHLTMMQRINNKPVPEKLVDTMFYKYDNNIGNLPSDLNSTVIKHFNRDTKKLIWPEIDPFTQTVLTEPKVIKRIENNCFSLDILICKFLKIDMNDMNFQIDTTLSADENWNHLEPLTSASKETFLFWYYFLDLLNKMFEFDPTQRITARDALDHEWFNLGILDEGITSFY
ncbi:similar to Saccharomyces cerevisiae YLL019C KNS1 Nonessential putative protein kinase of unknown cellular role [Maudiozyma barnettii]|uniref:Protein kinase domain-containing protein n=1 Tax=Maudiozyma barnettii TaxID=61262 RepID=A0A8H2ZG57_9SACH|nr:serine/threonine protein kinase KNS1 [Kazachstania barnettii]CAB4253060.1 similar to Saccharomyces cerevisiae YLL019C KNS1 Nonessential putative protein kinase of unknown cellular role [Kazachstania barnettii]CAD1780405.1 similar to Saccharomyces cerevisiae YLL019C KNS1 Nonessential putative protein kinase of unknown cellular role [Kazachstania barnettii]